MMRLFDEEQIMKSFNFRSERHDEARKTAERLVKRENDT